MCGLAGTLYYKRTEHWGGKERLERALEAMRRRGPDDVGFWCSSDNQVELGHCRLSVIDLTAAARQPMVDERTGCAIVFNGEIYNYVSLRDQLKAAGYRFTSGGDTEVLLKGYQHWGEGVLDRLRGMFAFAIWDSGKRALWLARDPYGIKPLYYVNDAKRFAFASQVRALRDYAAVDGAVDPAGVVGFMLLGSVPEPHTCYKSIRGVPAGHCLWVSKAGVAAIRNYASVAQVWREAARAPVVLGESELNHKVRDAVAGSVRAHQVADVPVGAFLSAGIDSGALVGLMSEAGHQDLRTFTLGFESFRNTDHDESTVARRIAGHYGSRHQCIWVDDDQALTDLPSALAAMDQPSIDGLNTWLVSKYTAAQGVKVAVSGVGGDELFGGYTHFHQIPRWHGRLKCLGKVPGLLSALGAGAGIAARFGLVNAKAAGLGQFGQDLAGVYMVRRGLFMPGELSRVLSMDVLREGLAELAPPQFISDAAGGIPSKYYAAIASLESICYLRNQLLRDSDWASMAHSLELRTPLVDYQLLRMLAPNLVRRGQGAAGKRPLAMAPRPALPTAILNRQKSGFSLPMDRWVQQAESINHWRRNRALAKAGVSWARRLAYAQIARDHPEVVVT